MKAMMRLRLNKKQINRSELLAEDGCGCLLGHYLLALGMDPEQLRPYCLVSSLVVKGKAVLPTHARWLLGRASTSESRDAVQIMEAAARSQPAKAVEIFAKHGVKLELFDPPRPVVAPS